jgi:hypothetical protein
MYHGRKFSKLMGLEVMQMHVRLPASEHSFLKKVAQIEGVSMNHALILILENERKRYNKRFATKREK